MKAITNLLHIHTSDYIELVFESYVAWCEIYSLSQSDFQNMVAHPSLYKWFMATYHNLEREFLFEIKNADCTYYSIKEINEVYDNITLKIGCFYPKSILKELRNEPLKRTNKKIIFNLN